jgi:hypothetical protein
MEGKNEMRIAMVFLTAILGACNNVKVCDVDDAIDVAHSAASKKFAHITVEKRSPSVKDAGNYWQIDFLAPKGLGGAPSVKIRKSDCAVQDLWSSQ